MQTELITDPTKLEEKLHQQALESARRAKQERMHWYDWLTVVVAFACFLVLLGGLLRLTLGFFNG